MGLRLLALVALALAGCGDVDVVQSVSEADAHRAVSALERAGVAARYEASPGPQRSATYRVRVASSQVARAVATLNDVGLPRSEQPGFAASWGDRSLVTSRAEERARAAQAVAGELARSLEGLDGVVSARVHVATLADRELDGESAQLHPTASVLVLHASAAPPLDASQVRALVAAAVEGMRADDVTVVFARRAPRSTAHAPMSQVGSIVVAAESAGALKTLLGVLFGCVVILGVSLVRLRWPSRRADAR
jgi:type III secretion protein J